MAKNKYINTLKDRAKDEGMSIERLRAQVASLDRPLTNKEKAYMRASLASVLFEGKKDLTGKEYAAISILLQPVFNAYFDAKEDSDRYVSMKTSAKARADQEGTEDFSDDEVEGNGFMDFADDEDEYEEDEAMEDQAKADAEYEAWANAQKSSSEEESEEEYLAGWEKFCKKEYADYYAQGDDAE